MDSNVFFYALIALFGVLISSVSQVLLKKAALKRYDSLINEYMNPLVIMAYALFVGATFLAVFAYKGIPLSLGPILESTGYIYVTIFGVKVFKEKINIKKIVALITIILGITIYALLG